MTWTRPVPLQRIEGLAILVAAIWIFAESGQTWWLFGLLLLAPDLSMLGYLISPAAGAVSYNLGHTFAAPAVVFGLAAATESSLFIGLGAVWLAHIGMDRSAGYGLKHPDAFTHTHLGLIGQAKRDGPAPS